MNVIEVKNVTKIYKLYGRNRDRLIDSLGLSKTPRYREHFALRDLSFSVEKGECVGIIGTNGAGKSTILKIITGVLNPTAGNVIIDGRISALLELGAGFNQEYTGIENIYLNGTMIGFTREEIDARMPEILEFADIGDFVYQPVKTYSSGMFVRLAFAIAINIEPEILIVDEALSVGDVFFQAKCFRKFEEFKEKGKTILFVSHDLSSIQRYCDRAILLNKGEKVQEGKPGEIIDLFKRILVGEEPERETVGKAEGVSGKTGDSKAPVTASAAGANVPSGELWKSKLTVNPNLQEYGDKQGEMIDYCILDDKGEITDTLIKGTRFSVRVRIRVYEEVYDPICAFTIRNLQSLELTGTNTKFEGKDIGPMKAGEERIITFTQEMQLQGGQYLLCLGLTRYDKDDFHVYHRLYDCLNISVVSIKNTVGFYDANSQIVIEEAGLE